MESFIRCDFELRPVVKVAPAHLNHMFVLGFTFERMNNPIQSLSTMITVVITV